MNALLRITTIGAILLSLEVMAVDPKKTDCVKKVQSHSLQELCAKFGGKVVKGNCADLKFPSISWNKVNNDTRLSCKESGGSIVEFSGHDTSQDRCQFEKRSEISSAEEISSPVNACDCGDKKCWYSHRRKGVCIDNPQWQRIYDGDANTNEIFKCLN